MSAPNPIDGRWRSEVSRRLEQGDGLEFTLSQFAASVGARPDDGSLKAFLEGLARASEASLIEGYRCPVTSCGRTLSPAGAPYAICPYCHTDYQLEGEEVLHERSYRLTGETSRDIRWMIVIHGMNSRAAWQEEFSWQIANRLRHSAPVLIYKYGWATIDVLVARLHRRLARQLGARMRIAIEQAGQSGRPSRPDVIAHSFGTLLLSLILEDPDFADLKLGRLILAGSIIRPDYDWRGSIEARRVEAVLNHVGGNDGAVPFAQFAIPGAGPGGKVGNEGPAVLNARTSDFSHSDFFEPANLRQLIADGGLWHSFLTHPLAHFAPATAFSPATAWTPAPLILRGPARCLGYLLFCLAMPFWWIRRGLDP